MKKRALKVLVLNREVITNLTPVRGADYQTETLPSLICTGNPGCMKSIGPPCATVASNCNTCPI